MKLTNKILLAFLILLFVSFAAFRLIIHSKIELVPHEYNKTRLLKENAFNKFTALDVKGGYYVHLIKGDRDSISIEGPDNLIDNYTLIENKNNILSIHSKTDLRKYFSEIEIRLFTKNIESISASNSAVIAVESFKGAQLNLAAEDSSIIDCVDCSFINSSISLKDKTVISLDKTQNAFVDVRNSAALFLEIDKGSVTGKVSNDGELLLGGEIKSNTIEKVESKMRGVK